MAAKKFVPLEKQSKKARKRAARAKRAGWYGINPVTKIVMKNKRDKPEKLKKKEVDDFR